MSRSTSLLLSLGASQLYEQLLPALNSKPLYHNLSVQSAEHNVLILNKGDGKIGERSASALETEYQTVPRRASRFKTTLECFRYILYRKGEALLCEFTSALLISDVRIPQV